ncbi:MAG: alpha-1,2-fucosyltransferase, partial [Candidatus Fonsibacter ubiquis]
MSISFNNFGNAGHLGNQMFQYAALKGIAAKHGYEYFIAPKESFGTRYRLLSSIYDAFDMEKCSKVGITDHPQISEETFNFDQNLFDNCPDNVDLNGYFQSEKY